jgi:NADH-quinone oxidoreductase subunit M
MPLYTAIFVIVAMSSVGLPGTNGFVGEFMILAGAFTSAHLGQMGPVLAVIAATGVILAAVYMLHAVLKMFWGPTTEENAKLTDLNGRERLVLAPLVALIFWIGLYPAPFLSRMEPALDHMAREYTAKIRASDANPDVRGVLERADAQAANEATQEADDEASDAAPEAAEGQP